MTSTTQPNMELTVEIGRTSPKQGTATPFYLPYEAITEHAVVMANNDHARTSMVATIIADQIARRIRDEHQNAIIVIDSKGELVDQVMRLIPDNHAQRVTMIDFANRENPAQLNFLSPPAMPHRDLCIDTILRILEQSSEAWGNRLEHNIMWALELAYDHNAALTHQMSIQDAIDLTTDVMSSNALNQRDEPGQNLLQALEACNNVNTRNAVSRHLQHGPSRAELQGPLRNLTRPYQVATTWGLPITEHTDTDWPIAKTIENAGILLISAGANRVGAIGATAVCNFAAATIEHFMGDQQRMPPHDRRSLFLSCDQFTDLTLVDWGHFTTNMGRHNAHILASAPALASGKVGAQPAFPHVSTIIAGAVSPADAAIISTQIDPSGSRLSHHTLAELGHAEFYVTIRTPNHHYPPCLITHPQQTNPSYIQTNALR